MFKFILHTLIQQKQMHNSTLDLFRENDDNDEVIAHEYAIEIQNKAKELNVTIDYYMMEFV